MARTGFYDRSQDLYLPKDTTTWDNLTPGNSLSWDEWTTYYQSLSTSTELEFTSNIIDFGYSHNVYPVITIVTRRDGALTTGPTYATDYPEVLIEASNDSGMAGAVSTTITKDTAPNYTGLGSYRYYRVTTTINSGTNTQPQGFRGIEVALLTDSIEETIEQFDTTTVDDGSTINRVIPTQNTYTSITYVGVTPTSTVTDTVVTGTSGGGGSLYVATGYVATGYFIGDSGTVTTESITTVPLIRVASKGTNDFTINVYRPNTAVDDNVTFDAYIRGLPPVAMDENGNIVRIA